MANFYNYDIITSMFWKSSKFFYIINVIIFLAYSAYMLTPTLGNAYGYGILGLIVFFFWHVIILVLIEVTRKVAAKFNYPVPGYYALTGLVILILLLIFLFNVFT